MEKTTEKKDKMKPEHLQLYVQHRSAVEVLNHFLYH